MKINFLDCTLRDGGYYNDWDFEEDLVNSYLEAMASSDVDYVELGLRRFTADKCLGASAFSTSQYLERLTLPDGPKYGVMVDAKTILNSGLTQDHAINKLFKDSLNEKIKLVRVAAHFDELLNIKEMLTSLKKLGFQIGLNIMQASQQTSENLSNTTKIINDWNIVDVLYFADSLGSMNQNDVERVYDALRASWQDDIGFHAHNNMGQACSNVKKAISLGCSWVDGTVSGMGRGAGNAETEYLLSDKDLPFNLTDLSKLASLTSKYFIPMKNKYGWGPSIEYRLGASLNLHPTYIQELCSDTNINKEDRYRIINDLGKLNTPSSYDSNRLQAAKSALSDDLNAVRGEAFQKFMLGRDVLIIAQTDITSKYEAAIVDYINAKKPIVVSINHPIDHSKIPYDFIGITHNEKYRKELNFYDKNHFSYIAPAEMFKSLGENFRLKIKYNYGLEVKKNTFVVNEDHCVIPFPLTLAYIIAFSIQAGVQSINLAGFKGHSDGDIRQKRMQNLFQLLAKENINLVSLTPSKYSLPERSLYDFH